MKLNISIKAKNKEDPLTSSRSDVEIEAAKLLQAAGVAMLAGTANYTSKPIIDRNGNTTGYKIAIKL